MNVVECQAAELRQWTPDAGDHRAEECGEVVRGEFVKLTLTQGRQPRSPDLSPSWPWYLYQGSHVPGKVLEF
jgi:hypothetical protein